MRVCFLARYQVQPNLKQDKRIDARSHIVHHNAKSARKSLQAAKWKWLDDVEATKKYKTRQQVFPNKGHGDERDHLSGYLIDDHEAGICASTLFFYDRGRSNAEQGDRQRRSYCNCNCPLWLDETRCSPPA